MVTMSTSRVETESSAGSTATAKPTSSARQFLHLVNPSSGLHRSRLAPRGAGAGEHDSHSRPLWRSALHWPSSPVLLKKNARVAATESSSVGNNGNQSDPPTISSSLLSRKKQQRDDQPQDDENSGCARRSGSIADDSECNSPCKRASTEGNNLLDLCSSDKKLSLANLRRSPAKAGVALQPSPSLPLSEELVKQASLHQELREFQADGDAQITMFPDYFSDAEKQMVQSVAQNLQLGCQVGEKNIAVYKLLAGSASHSHPNRMQRPCLHSSLGSAGFGSLADDVYVDVDELAQQGKDGFIARLRLRRLSSGGGVRRNMLWDVAELNATADGVADPVSEGEGGVYAVQSRSSGQKLALFKPAEEEKFVREGLFAGEGAVREEAAYVLDSRSNGFSGVPPTAVARLRLSSLGRAKQGAVQRFMTSSIGSMEGFGMPFDLERAQEFVPVEQVHRIALLDVRVFNTDRHPGNILLIGEKKPFTMVPIDHGCILPSWFHLSEARFDWLEYPQSRVAFSPAVRQYIASLDAERDAMALRALGIREECVTTLKICTLFLQLAAARSKTLHWMGNFMVRAGCFQLPSPLELAVQRACERTGISYTFEPNEFQEQRGQIEQGVLSRRPPNEFFLALEPLLLEAINSQA
ncbi:hypothetical protein BBJ28_00000749 [Nothophytophthora sp. Chile5]|nr:hypothetical protein BBJ28_00000749 [Nothophytophthora sp. Chile5]